MIVKPDFEFLTFEKEDMVFKCLTGRLEMGHSTIFI